MRSILATSQPVARESYITNLDGEIVQHVEYLPFGEVFIEERNNSWNTPYLFNGKELDEETGLYYYGARYYNPRESVWLSVDPLSGYNPVLEREHYIDGQHNGGVYNSFNHNTYGYCYQSPVLLVDPNGKQTEFHDAYLSPAELTGAAINEVRSAVSNIANRVINLFTEKETVTPRYIVSGSGRLTLVPDMPAESSGEQIVNSIGDVATIGLALLGGPEGVLFGKAGKSSSMLLLEEGKGALRGASKGSLSGTKKALEKAKQEIGLKSGESLPKGKEGKFGSPQRGDGKKGYRLDPSHPNAKPGSGEEYPHINFWDYTNGKRGTGGKSGAIPIKE